MIADVDMLGARVMCVVLREGDRRLVVAVEGDGVVGEVERFGDEPLQPNCFFGGVSCCDILGFGGGKSNDLLLPQEPGDGASIDEESVPQDSVPMFLSCAVRVRVSSNRVLRLSKYEFEMFGAEEVSIEVFDTVPMSFRRIRR